MDFDEYALVMRSAADAHESGRTEEATDAYRRLLEDPGLADVDRAMVAVNLATALTAAGAPHSEVEGVYDRGVGFESRWQRGFATESKAVWLAGLGRVDAARRVYQGLLAQGWASMDERRRWSHNVETLTDRP
ncbi:tetratricopeptide repeat protein [Cellulosimicrobium terreum]|nr:tetratricopeptide repeat protein [Cellulosimicrobium terreum]